MEIVVYVLSAVLLALMMWAIKEYPNSYDAREKAVKRDRWNETKELKGPLNLNIAFYVLAVVCVLAPILNTVLMVVALLAMAFGGYGPTAGDLKARWKARNSQKKESEAK